MHYTEIVKVSPPLSPPSLALPKPVQDNTAQSPLSSSVETIASILVALCLLAIATAVVFVYRWRFGQSVKNNHHESEIALVQGTGTYWLIFVLNITSDWLTISLKMERKKFWFYQRDEIFHCDMKRYLSILHTEFLCCDLIEITKYVLVDDDIVTIFSEQNWLIDSLLLFLSLLVFFLTNVSPTFGSYISLATGDPRIYCKNSILQNYMYVVIFV